MAGQKPMAMQHKQRNEDDDDEDGGDDDDKEVEGTYNPSDYAGL